MVDIGKNIIIPLPPLVTLMPIFVTADAIANTPNIVPTISSGRPTTSLMNIERIGVISEFEARELNPRIETISNGDCKNLLNFNMSFSAC